LTIGAFGVQRLMAHPPVFRLPVFASAQSQIAYRARPAPDPAFPHRISFYPRVALLNRQAGTVVVRLLVLRTGEVGDVSVIRSSGFPQLDAAALVVTGEWRFLPAIRNGQPISAEIDETIHFKLTGT